jgi:hypothetical protein
MKRLINTVLIVIVAAAIPATIFWIAVKANLRSAKNMQALEYALHSKEHHDIVFVGASRVIRHVNPKIIDSATGLSSYVLGIDGMGIVESNMIMQVYLKHHPKPKLMVINTDNNIFYTDGPLFNITDYYPYLKDSLIYACLAPYKKEYSHALTRARLMFLRLMGTTDYEKATALLPETTSTWYPKQEVFTYKGFQPVDHLWSRNQTHTLRKAERITARENGFELLIHMVKTCRNAGVQPAFLFTTQHQKADSIFINHQEIMTKVKAIADSLQVPFFNYEDLYIKSDEAYFIRYSMFNKTTGFFNYNHLNSRGANVLSRYLAQDLKDYLLHYPNNKQP